MKNWVIEYLLRCSITHQSVSMQNGDGHPLKRHSISQSARQDGILNTCGFQNIHTGSDPYSYGYNYWVFWDLCASFYRNRAIRHQYNQPQTKPSCFVHLVLTHSSSVANISSVHRGRQSTNSPRILSSASIRTPTVSCWMDGDYFLHSVTVRQQQHF